MTSHFRLNFHAVENLSIVNTNDTSNHFWNNNHISQVGLDDGWLFVGESSLLCLAKFLDQTHWLGLHTTVETSACTARKEFEKLVIGEIEELFQVDSTVLKFAKRALLGSSFSIQAWIVFSVSLNSLDFVLQSPTEEGKKDYSDANDESDKSINIKAKLSHKSSKFHR